MKVQHGKCPGVSHYEAKETRAGDQPTTTGIGKYAIRHGEEEARQALQEAEEASQAGERALDVPQLAQALRYRPAGPDDAGIPGLVVFSAEAYFEHPDPGAFAHEHGSVDQEEEQKAGIECAPLFDVLSECGYAVSV